MTSQADFFSKETSDFIKQIFFLKSVSSLLQQAFHRCIFVAIMTVYPVLLFSLTDDGHIEDI